MRRTRRLTAGAAAAVALAFVLAGCAGGSSGGGNSGGGGGSSSGGTLNLGAITTSTTFAAANSYWANESPYQQAVYDQLLHETPNATIVPWLATSWSYNASKTVLTMKLRTGVKFTDGTPFNASAAAQNVLAFRDGTSPNKSELALVAGAKAVDSSTLQITLKAPDPALLIYLAQNPGSQESPKAIHASNSQTVPVGSGPYTLDTGATVIGSKYVFKKNPNYWNKSIQHYDSLVINVYQNISTQVNAIKGGQVNGLPLIDNSANDTVKGSGYTLYPHELDWQGIMLLDRAGKMVPALAKVPVRQAINYAIDRAAMLKAVDTGNGTVTGQIFNKVSAAYDPSLDTMYPYNPAKAKQLLAQAGYPNGFTFPMPQVPVFSSTVYDLIKQYLGAVGIKVSYTQVALNDAITQILAPKFPAAFFRLQEDPTAWQVANFSMTTDAVFNPFHVTDPTIQSLVNTIQNGSTAQSAAASSQLNQHVVAQADFNPWYRVAGNFAADKNTNVVQQADNAYPYLWNITPKS
jgi:peptide/nickel transport system substrate-binding protein